MMIFNQLSPRENHVAGLLLECLTNKEIANKLNIAERTVKYHTGNIYRKFGIDSQAGHERPRLVMHLARMAGTLAAMLILCTVAHAQHSVALTWQTNPQPAGETIAATNIIKNGAALATVVLPSVTFTDTAVTAGQQITYSLMNVDSKGVNSAPFTFAAVTVPGGVTPPPPPPVLTPYSLSASIASIKLSAVAGAAVANQTLSVSDSSPSISTFSLSTPTPWLGIVSQAANDKNGNVNTVKVNSAGLAAGVYVGSIVVTMPDQLGGTYTNSPLSIPVNLTITAAPVPVTTCVKGAVTATSEVIKCTITQFPVGASTVINYPVVH